MRRLKNSVVVTFLACFAVAVAFGVNRQLKHERSRRNMEEFDKAIRESNRAREEWNRKEADEATKSGKAIAPSA